jgi:hypothetical protein
LLLLVVPEVQRGLTNPVVTLTLAAVVGLAVSVQELGLL